ncbi:MAG: CBS domain-containing protein [Planctomycetota bacterium]
MLVRDALVTNPLVVAPTTTMFELIEAVLGSNQTTASVVENGFLIGTVSAADVLRLVIPHYLAMDENLAGVLHATFFEEALVKLQNVLVGHVMEQPIHTLPPDAPLMSAVVTFVRHGRKTIPVVDHGRFIGAVTRRSVLRLMRSSVSDR